MLQIHIFREGSDKDRPRQHRDIHTYKSKFRDFNVKLDEVGILRCEGCLKFSPIPQETRSPILLNDQHPPSKLIILNIHECNKDSSGKCTLNEFKQKFWLLCGRHIAKNIIRACVTCGKRHCKSYTTQTQLFTSVFYCWNSYLWRVFVRNIYFVENDTMHKAWVTLYTSAASRAICLGLVPNMNSASFIQSFKRFVSRYGCPDNVISDNGSNFSK